ncbi:MAG: HD domain-containing protein [candidate division Zixibacteria bacterium]|nr:HD domain-containing protein [candidate division Zixibacteria bacterium]
MDRDTAYRLVTEKVHEGNLIKHIIAVEAVMRLLAQHFGEDVDRWGLVGLLHDLDYSETLDDPDRHSYLTAEWLKDYPEIDAAMIRAIHCHAEHEECRTPLEWALYATDPTTGLIVAAVLMHPSKKLAQLQVKSIKKRFKDKRFAAGARRDAIAKCSELGLTLEEFLGLALDGMRRIADELGF